MKHLFTLLCWAVPAAGLYLACTPKPSAPAAAKVHAQEVISGDDGRAAEALPLEDIDIPQTVTVYFDLGETRIKDESALAGAADLLRTQEGLRARIEGHACPLGPDALNERLAHLRAYAVAGWMESAGVPASRLVAEGRGERCPVTLNVNHYPLNRRAAITFERSTL